MHPHETGAGVAPPVACLTDFGLARAIETGSRLTRTGVALGTPAYMSPEQARGEVHDLTPATDVWALGCVAYELLTGRRPFEGATPAAVIAAVIQAAPPELGALRPGLPAGLADVVARALAPAPTARYRDAAELHAELERVLRGERPRARRPRTPRLLAGGLAVAGLCLATWVATRPDPTATGISPGPAVAAPPGPGTSEAVQGWALRTADPVAAEGLLSVALRAAPANGTWRLQRGLVRLALGRNDAAVEDWAAVPDGHPDAPAARLYRGLEPLFRLEDEQGPLAAANEALEQAAAGSGREARLARAALDLAAGRLAEAAAALRGQEGWEAAYLLAFLQTRDPRASREAGIRAFDTALSGGPPFAWAHLARAMLHLSARDIERARADLDAAIRLRPDYLHARTNRATMRANAGDLAGALEDYEAVLAVRPTYSTALLNRALIVAGQGRTAEALADLDGAIRAHPGNAGVRVQRAKLRRAVGDLPGAEADLAEVLAKLPTDPVARACRAALHQDAGRWDAALADYDVAIEGFPEDASLRAARGLLRIRTRDFVGARADLDAALALRPDVPEVRVNRALLREQTGDPAGARDDYDAALKLRPGHAPSLASRGRLRLEAGDAVGAVADFTAALQAAPPDWPFAREVEALLARARGSAEAR